MNAAQLKVKTLNDSSPLVLRYTFLSCLNEMGLGSLLHAFHVPLGGHFLSLNQGYILSKSQKVQSENDSIDRRTAIEQINSISVVTALMKSFSPAGKKLTPMLAISIQGFLYSVGILILGPTILGNLLGMILLSLWAFVQPILFLALLFGKSFFEGLWILWSSLAESLSINPESGIKFLFVLLLAKVFLAALTSVLVFTNKSSHLDTLSDKIFRVGENVVSKNNRINGVQRSILTAIARDLMSPLFISGFLISCFFAYFSHSTHVAKIWILLRPLAGAVLLFYILRTVDTQKLTMRISKKFPIVGKTLNEVLSKIASIQKSDRVPEEAERQY